MSYVVRDLQFGCYIAAGRSGRLTHKLQEARVYGNPSAATNSANRLLIGRPFDVLRVEIALREEGL